METSAEVLGTTAIKYFDLRQNRKQNYGFNFDKMLDPTGNTGVYLIYQYARINSIIAKSCLADAAGLAKERKTNKFKVTHKAEMDLALTVLQLPDAIIQAQQDLSINRLTDLLYDIATVTGVFYNTKECKVVGSADEVSRVLLLDAVRKVMKQVFDLLGMKTLERI